MRFGDIPFDTELLYTIILYQTRAFKPTYTRNLPTRIAIYPIIQARFDTCTLWQTIITTENHHIFHR